MRATEGRGGRGWRGPVRLASVTLLCVSLVVALAGLLGCSSYKDWQTMDGVTLYASVTDEHYGEPIALYSIDSSVKDHKVRLEVTDVEYLDKEAYDEQGTDVLKPGQVISGSVTETGTTKDISDEAGNEFELYYVNDTMDHINLKGPENPRANLSLYPDRLGGLAFPLELDSLE